MAGQRPVRLGVGRAKGKMTTNQWKDIERALADQSLETLDTETLRSFAQVEPSPSDNPAYHARYNAAMARIRHLLAGRDATEAEGTQMRTFLATYEQTERHHREQIEEARHQARSATVVAWIAIVIAAFSLFLDWFRK